MSENDDIAGAKGVVNGVVVTFVLLAFGLAAAWCAGVYGHWLWRALLAGWELGS